MAELQERLIGNGERETMTGFVQSLLNATKDDYEQLVKDIEARETELVALKDAARLIGLRLGVVEKKQHGGRRVKGQSSAATVPLAEREVETPEAPPGTAKTEHYRSLLKQFIQANGPHTMSELARKTGIPNGSMTAILNHPMFVKTAIGYGLSANHK